MGEPRFALLSLHVVLPQYPPSSLLLPVPALVFVQGEVIEEVCLLTSEVNV